MQIDQFLAPFAGSNISIVASVARQMLRLGIGPDEALERCAGYLEQLKASVGSMPPPVIQEAAPPVSLCSCPECGSPLRISPVNMSRCTNIGGDWHTSLLCSNRDCLYTELSIKTIQQWSISNVV